MITFWSGIAGDGPDGPLIFCTCTCTCAGIRGLGGRHTVYQRLWGWPTLAAVSAGHQAVSVWIADVAAFLAGHSSQLPTPDPALPGTSPLPVDERGQQAMDGDALVVHRVDQFVAVVQLAVERDEWACSTLLATALALTIAPV